MTDTITLAGRAVPRIGYGMGQVARDATTPEGFARGVALLRHAYDLGVRLYDTAHFYGDGLANRLLREAFADVREEVVYATKAGAVSVPDGPVPMTAAQHPAGLRQAVEANLETLGVDRVDLVYLRRMDFRPGLVVEGDQVADLDDQLATMLAMREEGIIGSFGLSHVRPTSSTPPCPRARSPCRTSTP